MKPTMEPVQQVTSEYPFVKETDSITNEVVPACLSTPNPALDDFHRIFCKDV
ncbi:unnamed protein product, partial [Rotaria magnacalcarata]